MVAESARWWDARSSSRHILLGRLTDSDSSGAGSDSGAGFTVSRRRRFRMTSDRGGILHHRDAMRTRCTRAGSLGSVATSALKLNVACSAGLLQGLFTFSFEGGTAPLAQSGGGVSRCARSASVVARTLGQNLKNGASVWGHFVENCVAAERMRIRPGSNKLRVPQPTTANLERYGLAPRGATQLLASSLSGL